MSQLEELENTSIEEIKAAKLLQKEHMTKSALILYSKALFAVLDYLILKKYKKLPKNHSERFRILEAKEPKTYINVDKIWLKYTDSYSKPADEDSIRLFVETIKEIVQDENISEKIKEALK